MKKYMLIWALVSNLAWAGTDNSIFWKATRDNETVFLLGVIHTGVESTELENKIHESFRSSSIYVTESELVTLDPKAVREEITRKYTEPTSPYINDLLEDRQCTGTISKATYLERMSNLLSGEIATKSLAFRTRAIAHVLFSYAPPPSATDMAAPRRLPLEEKLRIQARQNNMQMAFLDPEFWVSLDSLSHSDACHLIDGMLTSDLEAKAHSSPTNERDELEHLWLKGDAKEISRFFYQRADSGSEDDARAYHHWFALRNRLMDESIEALSQRTQKQLFVAVGAAHLVEQDGLIQLLRNHGFTVNSL